MGSLLTWLEIYAIDLSICSYCHALMDKPSLKNLLRAAGLLKSNWNIMYDHHRAKVHICLFSLGLRTYEHWYMCTHWVSKVISENRLSEFSSKQFAFFYWWIVKGTKSKVKVKVQSPVSSRARLLCDNLNSLTYKLRNGQSPTLMCKLWL